MGSGLLTCDSDGRPLRLEHAGALWHVTSRGDARRGIFEDEHDRDAFLDVLGRVVGMFRWKLYAFVLMGNHFHLLVETPEPNLSRGMRQLNGVYTQRFNRRHLRVGHVLQGRFKGILVQKEPHLMELCRYVVLNPVRAGMVRTAKDWPWSSYRATAGIEKAPQWLEIASTLERFGRRGPAARAAYRRFVSDGVRSNYEPWTKVRGQIVLGSESFERGLGSLIGTRKRMSEIPKRQRLLGRPTLEMIGAAVAEAFDVTLNDLRRPQEGAARHAVAHIARVEGAWPIAEIGEMLGVKSWSASHPAAAGGKRVREDPDFRRTVTRVIESLRVITGKQT